MQKELKALVGSNISLRMMHTANGWSELMKGQGGIKVVIVQWRLINLDCKSHKLIKHLLVLEVFSAWNISTCEEAKKK